MQQDPWYLTKADELNVRSAIKALNFICLRATEQINGRYSVGEFTMAQIDNLKSLVERLQSKWDQ